MTLVAGVPLSGASDRVGPTPLVARDARVHWGRTPFLFGARLADRSARDEAERVLAPWRVAPASPPIASWAVESCDGAWSLLRDGDGVRHRVADLATAILVLERLATERIHADRSGVLTLHGALVARAERGVLVLGAGYAGKSTLAIAAAGRGWRILGDDLVTLEAGGASVMPTPRRLQIRRSAVPLLTAETIAAIERAGTLTEDEVGYHVQPADLDSRWRAEPIAIERIVFLRAEGGASLRDVNPAEALVRLLSFTNRAGRREIRESLEALTPLANRAPARELGRGPLEAMLDALESDLDGSAT